ncbi:MAG: putative aminoglycoside phosphotransferase [Candidatus Heimdallarchaeota archaeon LC_2]|nr:MAG: putative aminoglycoside phosphotransferase [Candidatus Heimdallarchaeota archaeon LC_2]
MPIDTIDVREDEKFDEKALAEYIKGKIPGTKNPSKLIVTQFGGGVANLTYSLKYDNYEYVLRRPPLGVLAKSSHDMGREFKVLSVLHKVFKFAPEALLYCDDLSIIGTPFFIMNRKDGIVIRKKFPNSYPDSEKAAYEISVALVDSLAELHSVNYQSIGLEDLGRPEGFIIRQIEGWYKRWIDAKEDDNPMMDDVYNWLKSNIPNNSDYSIIHNDYKLDNMMFDANNPSKMIAIFDWDMCTLGDPLSDLGALLTYWTEPSDPDYFKEIAMMPIDIQGFMTRKELVQRYESKTGRKIENINFYHALGLFRLVVIVAQIYIRFLKGQTKDKRFGPLGKLIPLIIKASHEIANTS